MGKLVIVNDKEKFTPSFCNCEFCQSTHRSNKEWKYLKPKTRLQKNMKKIIKKLEKKLKGALYSGTESSDFIK